VEALALASTVTSGAVAFLVIAYRLARAARLSALPELTLIASGFGVLGFAQALSLASYFPVDERDAYTFYVGSASFSLAGYSLILLAKGKGSNAGLYAINPALLLASSIDIVSGLLALLVAYSSRGIARACFASLALSHVLRAIPLVGGGLHVITPLSPLVLLGEVVRVVSASVLALYYAKGALRVEEE